MNSPWTLETRNQPSGPGEDHSPHRSPVEDRHLTPGNYQQNQEYTIWPWRGPFTASLASKGLLSPLGTCTPSSSTSTQQYILFSTSLQHILFSTSSSAHSFSTSLHLLRSHVDRFSGVIYKVKGKVNKLTWIEVVRSPYHNMPSPSFYDGNSPWQQVKFPE